jgi:hypothetical protein
MRQSGISGVVYSAHGSEKNRNKDIILWVVTVLLVGLAIFWYMKPH